ncbi:MAG: FAD-dependent oxidoreductase [Hahellaceae bacterium]|nr:FAD-dependent oxidoreductase [Hahellaceae bacterium]MCP5210739.1 FAD-dependent oxidoreductase [Hahellaceae bacterium]
MSSIDQDKSSPVVIVGTGLAGYSLAREFRKLDKDSPLLLITADDGHSYSKPMLSTGFTKKKTADQLSMADPGKMAEQLNAEIRTYTTVTGIDSAGKALLIGDERVVYSRLVLAWGADVIQPPVKGNALENVFSINDLTDYRKFRAALEGRKRILIMGAGLIGCEFANDLLADGYSVDIVAPSSSVMPTLLPELAANAVQQALQENGVRFHLEQTADSIDHGDNGLAVQLSGGEIVHTDIVISAVGLRPRTAIAAQSGLTVNRGIVVDRSLQTSAADVYALGDCAEVDGHVMLYVLPLMAGARALAKTLAGTPAVVKYEAMPVMVKTPSCPVSVALPPKDSEGEWKIDVDGNNVRAVYINTDGNLLGFALTGTYVDEKQVLSKQLPPIHHE